VSTGTPQIVDATVHQALLPDLPAGAYRVIWRVTSDDGHPVSDTFSFTVTAGAATSSAPSSSATPSTAAPTTVPSATPAGTDATSQSLQSSGVSAPVLWGIAAAAVLILVAVLVVLRSRRPTKENS
jgi:hypothetical protein